MPASVFIATSLDGFIARRDGTFDWLLGWDDPDEPEDYGFDEFMASVDALVMGRGSFESVRGFEEWPYGQKPVIVLTHRTIEIPDAIAGTVETMSGSPQEIVERLAERGVKHLYVDGGKTIQGFLAEGLIQRMIITRVPILLGDGIPLFGPLPHDIRLRHVATQMYPSGLVKGEYEVT